MLWCICSMVNTNNQKQFRLLTYPDHGWFWFPHLLLACPNILSLLVHMNYCPTGLSFGLLYELVRLLWKCNDIKISEWLLVEMKWPNGKFNSLIGESLSLVSVSRLKVTRLSVSSQSRKKFWTLSRLGLVSDEKFQTVLSQSRLVCFNFTQSCLGLVLIWMTRV